MTFAQLDAGSGQPQTPDWTGHTGLLYADMPPPFTIMQPNQRWRADTFVEPGVLVGNQTRPSHTHPGNALLLELHSSRKEHGE